MVLMTFPFVANGVVRRCSICDTVYSSHITWMDPCINHWLLSSCLWPFKVSFMVTQNLQRLSVSTRSSDFHRKALYKNSYGLSSNKQLGSTMRHHSHSSKQAGGFSTPNTPIKLQRQTRACQASFFIKSLSVVYTTGIKCSEVYTHYTYTTIIYILVMYTWIIYMQRLTRAGNQVLAGILLPGHMRNWCIEV